MFFSSRSKQQVIRQKSQCWGLYAYLRPNRNVEQGINNTISSAEDAAVTLGIEFPGLEDVITKHYGNELRESQTLTDWLAKEDHVEFPGDESQGDGSQEND